MNVSGLDLGSLDHWVPRRVWMCSVPFEFALWLELGFEYGLRVRVCLQCLSSNQLYCFRSCSGRALDSDSVLGLAFGFRYGITASV